MHFTKIQIPFTENKRKNVRCDNVDEKISSRKCLTVTRCDRPLHCQITYRGQRVNRAGLEFTGGNISGKITSPGYQVFEGRKKQSKTISEYRISVCEGFLIIFKNRAENSDFKLHYFRYATFPNPSVPAQIKMLRSDVT